MVHKDQRLALLLLLGLAALTAGQFAEEAADDGEPAELGEAEEQVDEEADSGGAAKAAILMHRQELADDGTFNYAFQADNGLQQREAFHPDGSRTGSYSYVDPAGETVLVNYRADKFGFHVLDGSSIPSTKSQLSAPPGTQPNAQPSQTVSREQAENAPLGFWNQEPLLSAQPLPAPRSAVVKARAVSVRPHQDQDGRPRPMALSLQQRLYRQVAVPLVPGGGASASAAASTRLHLLQRGTRHADPQLYNMHLPLDMDSDEEASDIQEQVTAEARNLDRDNDLAGEESGEQADNQDDGSYDHHALKYDDGSYEPHAANYDDGSYEPHAAKYDDGSYEPHAAKYDDGSYGPHAAKYDDGSYEKYARLYAGSGDYQPGAASAGAAVHEESDE